MNRCDFQKLYAYGSILNVGCETDPCGICSLPNVTNLDIRTRPDSHVDIVADARVMPLPDNTFDTVILGDILEHMSPENAIQVVRESVRVSKGIVVITCPEDYRPIDQQGKPIYPGELDSTDYANFWHIFPITWQWLIAVLLACEIHEIYYRKEGNYHYVKGTK